MLDDAFPDLAENDFNIPSRVAERYADLFYESGKTQEGDSLVSACHGPTIDHRTASENLRDLKTLLPGKPKEVYQFAELLADTILFFDEFNTLQPHIEIMRLLYDLERGFCETTDTPIEHELVGRGQQLRELVKEHANDMISASFPNEFADEAIIYLNRRWRNIERPHYTRAEARIDAENDAQ